MFSIFLPNRGMRNGHWHSLLAQVARAHRLVLFTLLQPLKYLLIHHLVLSLVSPLFGFTVSITISAFPVAFFIPAFQHYLILPKLCPRSALIIIPGVSMAFPFDRMVCVLFRIEPGSCYLLGSASPGKRINEDREV